MMKKIMMKFGALINCIALMFVIQGANTACCWVFHQAEFPEEANKYKKAE